MFKRKMNIFRIAGAVGLPVGCITGLVAHGLAGGVEALAVAGGTIGFAWVVKEITDSFDPPEGGANA